jgi:TatD DNase family protein
MLVDTHCHLYFDHYDEDRSAVLTRAGEAGVGRILVPGIDLATSRAAVALADSHPSIYAAVGIHPNSARAWQPGALETLEALIAHPKVVAIGEIGLDYYRRRTPRALQRGAFREQLLLADRAGLPVVVHTRNASQQDRACIRDVLNILDEIQLGRSNDRPGVVHSFFGDEDEAASVLAQGFYVGITGPVTYNNADELRQVVAALPLERILIETDGPFLTPHPLRGKRNEPAYVSYVAAEIAQILHEPQEYIAEVTSSNARRLFQWRDTD